jgi:hypothetical protein
VRRFSGEQLQQMLAYCFIHNFFIHHRDTENTK